MTKARIHFEISAPKPASHVFHVSMTVREPNAKEQVFSLPAWIPGSYLLREFAKNLGPITGRVGEEAMTVHKLDRNSWAVRGATGPNTGIRCLRLGYVGAFGASGPDPWLLQRHQRLLNGPWL